MDVFHGEGAQLLISALLSLRTEEDCRAFLEDLMTGKEIQDCWRSRSTAPYPPLPVPAPPPSAGSTVAVAMAQEDIRWCWIGWRRMTGALILGSR